MGLLKSSLIREEDIFTFVVVHEDGSINISDALSAQKKLLLRLGVNIFTGVWRVFYDIVYQADVYNIPLGNMQFNEIVATNALNFVKKADNDLLSLINPKDDDLSDLQLADNLVDLLLSTFNTLQEMEVEDADLLLSNLQLYLDNWGSRQLEQISTNQQTILATGMTIGKKTLRGLQDAMVYATNGINFVKDIVENNESFSEVIDTSRDDITAVKNVLNNEEDNERIADLGVPSFDDVAGGFHRGEILVVQGGSGVGKSRMSVNVAYNAMSKYHKNVLFISLEQKVNAVFPMFEARDIAETVDPMIPNMTDKDIRRHTYKQENSYLIDDSLSNLVNNHNKMGRLRIEGRSIQASGLKSTLSDIWDSGFNFDVVVLDYIGLVAPDPNSSSYEAVNQTIHLMKTECKNFKGKGFLAIIPNQLTKEAEQALDRGDVSAAKNGGSESMYIKRDSDIVITLHQDEDQEEDDKMSLYTFKLRLGEGIPQIILDVNKGKCLFVDSTADDGDEGASDETDAFGR